MSNIPFRVEHSVHECRECEFPFLVPIRIIRKMRKKPYCPRCGENLFVEQTRIASISNPNGHCRNYTDEEEEQIRTAYKKGLSNKEIGELINRTERGIRAKINRMWEAGKL